MLAGKLTDLVVEALKGQEKSYTKSDGKGMSIIVTPNGTKWWKLDFSYKQKRNSISLGVYPNITLAQARQKTVLCQKALLAGIHPKVARDNTLINFSQTLSFKEIAESWFSDWKKNKTKTHLFKIYDRLTNNIFPLLADLAIKDVTERSLLTVIKDIEISGSLDKAHRVRQTLHQIFKYAIKIGVLTDDPTKNLRGQQLSLVNGHYPCITSKEQLKQVMIKIKNYNGHTNSKLALRFAPLVFTRPSSLLNSRWDEILWDEELWIIPADKNTNHPKHIVPLCKQALEILTKLNPRKLKSSFIFHSHSGPNIRLSANTLNHALTKIATEKDQRITVSGFRTVAETNLRQMGWSDQAVGAQLGKSIGGYAHQKHDWSLHLSERKSMMIAWADYLESLTQTSEQVSIYAAIRPKLKDLKHPNE